MKMMRHERYALAFIYLFGGASVVASLLRYTFIRIAYLEGFQTPPMMVELGEKIKIWTAVEYGTAFVAFCLPSFRALLRRRIGVRGQITGSSAHTIVRLPEVELDDDFKSDVQISKTDIQLSKSDTQTQYP